MKKKTIMLFILFGLLTACSSTITTAQPSPSRSNTESPRPTLTLTLTPIFQQSQIAGRQSTAAVGLTQVADRLATVTARIMTGTASAPTPNYVATYEALEVAVMASSTPQIIDTYSSPDGQFLAQVVRYDCVQVSNEGENAYEQLKLVQEKYGSEKVVNDQLQFCGGIGAYGLGGLFWSPGGRYFYYTASKYGVPDGDFCELWVRDMFRVDAISGIVDCTPGMGELMADDKTMIIPGKGEFILWDLDTGEMERIPYKVPDAHLISYQLSPARNSLVYIQTENCAGFPGKSYLVILDFAILKQTLLLEIENPPLVSVTWETSQMLTLWESGPIALQYDLVTDELQPIK